MALTSKRAVDAEKFKKNIQKYWAITDHGTIGWCKGNCKDGLNQNLAGDPKLIYSAIIMSQL